LLEGRRKGRDGSRKGELPTHDVQSSRSFLLSLIFFLVSPLSLAPLRPFSSSFPALVLEIGRLSLFPHSVPRLLKDLDRSIPAGSLLLSQDLLSCSSARDLVRVLLLFGEYPPSLRLLPSPGSTIARRR